MSTIEERIIATCVKEAAESFDQLYVSQIAAIVRRECRVTEEYDARKAFERWFPIGKIRLEFVNSGDAPTAFEAGYKAALQAFLGQETK